MNHVSRYLILLTAGLLAACAVGPDYKQPESHLPEGWAASQEKTADAVEANWWQHFNDPVLDGLIEKALMGNDDLKVATARIASARAARGSARADLLPQVNAKASATREANQFPLPFSAPGIKDPFNTYQAGFDASWELDLFGGHRRALEAASADLGASIAERNEARVSLLAEVARTYVDIRRAQNQLELTKHVIASNQSTLDIARRQFKAGAVARESVTQAEIVLAQAQAEEPRDANGLAQAEYGMDLLLGADPGTAKDLVGEIGPVPVSDKELVLAAPAVVIANRPDIKVAERDLAAATARQGVAVAQYFPDISLSGFLGFLSPNLSDMVSAGNKSWMAEGNILLPILNFGKLEANENMANAAQEAALATYRKTILSALVDVNRAVTGYREQERHLESLANSEAGNKRSLNVARKRYDDGATSKLDVLESERALYRAQGELLAARAQTSQDMIAVYKSLGGGWKQPVK